MQVLLASYAEDEIQTRYYLTPFAVAAAKECTRNVLYLLPSVVPFHFHSRSPTVNIEIYSNSRYLQTKDRQLASNSYPCPHERQPFTYKSPIAHKHASLPRHDAGNSLPNTRMLCNCDAS